MMMEVTARGKSIVDIQDALKRIPVEPAMINAIKNAHSWGWELQIISDANSFFIQTVLSNNHIDQYFTRIHTNPAFVDEKGVLRIQPYWKSPAHQCPLCPSNMCKGMILDGIRTDPHFENYQTIYIGDGGGDYCPSLRLHCGDHVLARQGYPLLRLLESTNQRIKAQVHSWSSAVDVESCLHQLYSIKQNIH
ncbi:hypothetical protein KP509_30G058200 [Ceratopteris richardii]|nr:hypothetical protein KP509_30G058200 [Ceratopteris richardii]